MAKNLVIVESPAKCRTISKYLGADHAVKATMGHIIDLPEKELGVDLKNDFKPKYTASKGKGRILKMLKEEAAKADTIYLAPDPDREGEAIAWHVAQTVAKSNGNIKRVMFNEITKRAVLSAFDHPQEINMNKVNAQQARRILDRIVGYQISPFLWRTVYRGLSAGRVQSVTLRLICEREDEINAFNQEEYWSIRALLTLDEANFGAKLISVDGEKAVLPNEESAKAITARCNGQEFKVVDVQKTKKRRKPYAPFITSTMQQEAARKLGFSAAKTMMVAQQLYEGLEVGDLGSTGLITYMRTDSTRSADEAITSARELVTSQFDENHLPEKPRVYGKSKNAQDAHEAIRPVQVNADFSPRKIKGYLSIDQFKLYDLIWKRFLASQMADAVFDQTRVDIDAAGCIYRANGSVMRFDGFLALYDESNEDKGNENDDQNVRLPDLQVNDRPTLQELIEKQHFTQPPPRYTEASLVRELEDRGIGRPSTYAQIIDTLKKRQYVNVENKRFFPTEVGTMVKGILVREFPDVFEVGFTATMETTLDKIETGDADWVQTLKDFYAPFSKELEEAKKDIQKLKAENQEVTDRTCPECGNHNLIVKWSRNGRFLACQGFPACRYTEPLEKPSTTETDEKCDKCGAPMVILEMKNTRFLGCSRYPDCRNTKSLTIGIHCPQPDCEGMLIERRTKRGKTFYGCSAYPKCNFATWDRPVDEKCVNCGYPILVLRETKRKGTYKRCLQCKSEYTVEQTETSESDS